jgi:hypothetical protein
MPDSGADVADMSLEAVQAELGSYRPATSFAVVSTAAWAARRARLWRRLDELTGVRKQAIAKAVAG